MSLTEYRRKRHFGQTREPEPGMAVPEGQRTIFVVQLHHASRRHYDFRLQVGDALKSWAVPKGPSFDPSVKRLAAEVEDHPLDYAGFEGEIPHGQYGGGHVALFDTGIWTTQGDAEAQLAKGHLKFELFGERLKGAWHLVRSGRRSRQPEWLLFKADDAFAGPVESDDLLAGVTPPPPEDAKRAGGPTARASAKKKAAAMTTDAPTAGKRKVATAKPAVPAQRRRRVDWAARALELPKAKRRVLADAAFEPQLAKMGDSPPVGDEWLHEVKWDGYRIVATIVGGRVRLWSRNALEWTQKLPEVVSALESLRLDSAALDGELIAGRGTQQDFGVLQGTLSGERNSALSYALFDLLHLEGVAIDQAPLIERKTLLARLLDPAPPHLAYSSHVTGDGAQAFAVASEGAFEGIISKRAGASYHAGRGDDWRKTKRQESDEFAVVGYTPPKGSRTGFGSLLLARPDAALGWVYVGRVGSGFTDPQIREIRAGIGKAGSTTPTVHVPEHDTDLRGALWFEPRFVVEVNIRGRGREGLLRQPSLKTVRADKDVADLLDPDTGAVTMATKPKKAARTASKALAPAPAARGRDTPTGEVKISSPTRVVFPDSKITKQQVADYYATVMPYLLPEIAGRPLSVIRCPDGAGGNCFFQKHHTAGLSRAGTVRLKEEAGNQANYLVVDTPDAVMELVQFNALEFHPWGALAATPDTADRIVFDLDPGPDVQWQAVKDAAVHVRDLLQQMGLVSYLRATGGKGLHVVVPLNPGCDWSVVKPFARGFAEALATSAPDRYIAVSTLKLRKALIFVDYLRNGRGATAVSSYSLRARDGAPAAVPLAWSELAALESGHAFDIASTPERLARQKKDPWDGFHTVQQDLDKVGRHLSGDSAPADPGAMAKRGGKAVAKTPAARPAVAGKTVAKTPDAKKGVAKKALAKKAVAKKAVAKKAVAKKAVAKKAVAKKAVAKRSK